MGGINMVRLSAKDAGQLAGIGPHPSQKRYSFRPEAKRAREKREKERLRGQEGGRTLREDGRGGRTLLSEDE